MLKREVRASPQLDSIIDLSLPSDQLKNKWKALLSETPPEQDKNLIMVSEENKSDHLSHSDDSEDSLGQMSLLDEM